MNSFDVVSKVLVTGHDGYVGSVLVERLLTAGYEVVGLDTCYYEDCDFTQGASPGSVIRKDIRDVALEDLSGVDAVIHLAGLSNDPVGELDPELTLDINYRASVSLAKLAKQSGVRRFLYASSCSLYGAGSGDWLDESSPMVPLTAYARSKVLSEGDILPMADENFSPIMLRFATVFGISPKLRMDLVVNNLAGWAKTTGKIQILSDGSPWRPLIHVEDVAAAYEFFLHAPKDVVHGQKFNVGFNDQNYQVQAIAEQVAASYPEAAVSFASTPDLDSRSYRVSFDKFQSLYKKGPHWDLKAGIEQIAEAFRDNGLTYEDFTGRDYTRLNQLIYLIDAGLIDSNLRWTDSR